MPQHQFFKKIIALSVLVLLSLSPVLAQASSVLYDQALVLMEQGEYTQSLALLDQLQASNKKQAIQGKLKLYTQIGDNPNIIKTIDQLLKYSRQDTGLLIQKSISLRNLGKWEDAEGIMNKIKDKIQKNPEHLVEYGRYLMWKQDFSQARLSFERALKLSPYMSTAKLGLAYYHVWQKEEAQALVLVNEILQKDESDLNALILKGWLQAWQSQFKDSLVSFHKALDIAPNHPEVIRGIAQNYTWDGQESQSFAYYNQLLAIQRDNPDVMLQMGKILQKMGKYGKAVGILRAAHEIAPERVDIKEELDLAENWASNIDDSIRKLRQSISLNQGNVDDFVNLGKAYNWIGQLDDADKAYQQALKKDENNIQLLYGLAEVKMKLNDLEEAKKLLKKILEIKSDFVDAKIALRDIEAEFKPSLMIQHSFDWSKDYIPSISETNTINNQHHYTVEYSQKLHSFYTLTTGYTLTYTNQVSKLFDAVDFHYTHNQFYIMNQLSLPHRINILFRYDFNSFGNRKNDINFANFNGNQTAHGGFIILQVPYKFNNFSFRYVKAYQPVMLNDMELLKAHNISLSDDFVITEHLTALVEVSASHDSLSSQWRWTYIVHPRFRLPFFPQVTVEYEMEFSTHPDRHNHTGIVNAGFPIGSKIFSQVDYRLKYFSQDSDISHRGTLTVNWQAIRKLGFSLNTSLDYYQQDVTWNFLTNAVYQF